MPGSNCKNLKSLFSKGVFGGLKNITFQMTLDTSGLTLKYLNCRDSESNPKTPIASEIISFFGLQETSSEKHDFGLLLIKLKFPKSSFTRSTKR